MTDDADPTPRTPTRPDVLDEYLDRQWLAQMLRNRQREAVEGTDRDELRLWLRGKKVA